MLLGISPCLLHADPQRPTFDGRALLFVERSMADWAVSLGAGAAAIMPGNLDAAAARFDGLILHGGADVSPTTYGEEPRRPEWGGDAERDAYELAMVEAFVAARKPILGVCRGHQLLNVWRGGTLRQDIPDEVDGALPHRAPSYAQNAHDVAFTPGGLLARLHGFERGRINSVHHQSVKELGDGFVVEATSPEDGIVEAIRLEDPDLPWIVGVQWHPEFQRPEETDLVSPGVVLAEFMRQCEAAATG